MSGVIFNVNHLQLHIFVDMRFWVKTLIGVVLLTTFVISRSTKHDDRVAAIGCVVAVLLAFGMVVFAWLLSAH